ncbi:MAG: hypothetical protein ACYTEW_22460 [Planctomycetota bacterium]|jgi:hypothetical protein
MGGYVDERKRIGLFQSLARFLPFDFAQGKLLRCAPLEMTGVEILRSFDYAQDKFTQNDSASPAK